MKNKLIVIACLLLVVLAFMLVGKRYEDFNRSREDRIIRIAAEERLQASNKQKLYDEAVRQRNDVYKQCLVGLDAWKVLTPALQTKTPMPDCELSFS